MPTPNEPTARSIHGWLREVFPLPAPSAKFISTTSSRFSSRWKVVARYLQVPQPEVWVKEKCGRRQLCSMEGGRKCSSPSKVPLVRSDDEDLEEPERDM